MTTQYLCDRCGNSISQADQSLLDFLKKQYPNKDICPNCDIDIQLAESCARQDTFYKRKPGTTALMMLKRYE